MNNKLYSYNSIWKFIVKLQGEISSVYNLIDFTINQQHKLKQYRHCAHTVKLIYYDIFEQSQTWSLVKGAL